MSAIRTFIAVCRRREIVLPALKLAFVVGTVLNLINQGNTLASGLPVSWPHLALNYLVPFCVSTYSAATNQLRIAERRDA